MHERDREDRVQEGSAGGDPQGSARVPQAAQHACRGEDEQHARQAGSRPAQVGDGVRRDSAVGAEPGDGPGCGEDEGDGKSDTERHGEPQSVDAGLERLGAPASARAPRDGGSRGVREEDAQPDDGHQERRGERQAGELGGAQAADDGGVDEDEERLGDECAESGERERDDLPVQGLILR